MERMTRSDALISGATFVIVIGLAWIMLRPYTPKWIRDIEKRNEALAPLDGVLARLLEERPNVGTTAPPEELIDPVMSVVAYRKLIEHEYAEVEEFLREPDGSQLIIDVYDTDAPAMSGTAMMTLREAVKRRAYMAGVYVHTKVRPRGYASGIAVELRLSRP